MDGYGSTRRNRLFGTQHRVGGAAAMVAFSPQATHYPAVVAFPVPGGHVGHRLLQRVHTALEAASTSRQSRKQHSKQKETPHSIAHREAFVEDAAMAREMFRL